MPILRFFAPQGRHVAQIGVTFGKEEGTGANVPTFAYVANFTPIGARVRVYPKLKFLLRFDQNVEYKRFAVSLARFSQNLQFVPRFSMR